MSSQPKSTQQIPAAIPQRQSQPLILSEGPATPNLDNSYLINIDNEKGNISLLMAPGQDLNLTRSHVRCIRAILEQNGLCKKGMTVSVTKTTTQSTYDKVRIGTTPWFWVDPNNPKRKTTFLLSVKNLPISNPTAASSAGASSRLRDPASVIGSQMMRLQYSVRSPSPSSLPPVSSTMPKKLGRPSAILQSSKSLLPSNPKKQQQPVELIEIVSSSDSMSESEEDDEDMFEKIPKQNNKTKSIYLNPTQNISVTIIPNEKDEYNKMEETKPFKQNHPKKIIGTNQVAATIVLKGGNLFTKKNAKGKQSLSWRLPSKSIVPCEKSLSALYKISDLPKFQETHKELQVSYGIHPFLGDQFIVATPPPPNVDNVKVKSVNKRKQESERDKKLKTPIVEEDLAGTRLRTRQKAPKSSRASSITSDSKQKSSLSKNIASVETRGVSTRRRMIVREMTPVSSSSSSSDDSSSSVSSSMDDDDEFKPNSDEEELHSVSRNKNYVKSSTTNKRPTVSSARKYDTVNSRGYICFSELNPSKPLRRGADGQIHFNIKSRLRPVDYYKNEDIFVNWEKFVRNESSVSAYYKTIISQNNLCTLVVYHLEKESPDCLQYKVDRSVELVSDGTIKISLEGQEVTDILMRYINIETTTDLNALLINLQYSSFCLGSPDAQIVSIFPGGIFREEDSGGVWYSSKCTRVVFDPDREIFNIKARCSPCTELRKGLLKEKIEIERMNKFNDKKQRLNFNVGQRGRNKQTKIIWMKPPPVEKMQVRKALVDLFKDFWVELGLKIEKPDDTEVTIKDSANIPTAAVQEIKVEENPPLVAEEVSVSENGVGVNLPLPEDTSNLITLNHKQPPPQQLSLNSPLMEFDATGQSFLTLSDIQINPSDIQQMIPEFSSEMIASLMNSSAESDSMSMFCESQPIHQPMMMMMDLSMPMDVTTTTSTGSLQGSIMSSGISGQQISDNMMDISMMRMAGGPMNPNVAIPVMTPGSDLSGLLDESLAGAIGGLLFPTFNLDEM